MQALLESGIFRDGVNKVLNVVGQKKISGPILNQALVLVEDGYIQISATDSELSAKIKIPANIEKPGSFCVQPKHLFEILRELA